MRHRRDILALIGGTALAWPPVARAQPAKVPTVGVLWHAGNAEQEGSNYLALVKGFADIGFVDGRTIRLEHRFPNEEPARFRSMAAELASISDVIVVIGANAPPYAKAATTTVPIVFALVPDPIGTKLITNLARPDGNITGFTNSAADLIGKRLELLKDVIPGLARVALLVNSNSQLAETYAETTRTASAALGLAGPTFAWKALDDLDGVFAGMRAAGTQAVIVNPDGWWFTNRAAIAAVAMKYKLPISTYSRQTLDAGALMAYGVDHDAICRRVAIYVDRLLKGTKPADLPVEQPTKFEFLINLKAAHALGLTIPAVVLARADEVIE